VKSEAPVLTTQRKGNTIIIKYENHILDILRSPHLKSLIFKEVANNKNINIIVDLSNVEICDSAGMNVLLSGKRAVESAGGKFAVIISHPFVIKLFTIMQLHKILSIHHSLDEIEFYGKDK